MASVTFPPALGGDGSTVTDDANPSTGLANGGHRTRFVAALAQAVACMSGAVALVTSLLGSATTQANNAAASAASALTAPGTNATSTSSVAIGTGSKSLTLVQTGKSFVVGQWVTITDSAAPSTNWMLGAITAFNSGTGAMTVNVTSFAGGGTLTAWAIAASAPTKPGMTIVPVSGTTQTAAVNNHYTLNNAAATAVTMPTTFVAGDPITVSPNNGRYDNTVDFGAKTVRGPGGTATGVVTLNAGAPMQLVAIDSTTWMML